MEPGFFLDLAENTGDNLSYVLLPVNNYCDIPLRHNPVTIMRSVVRIRDIVSSTPQVALNHQSDLPFIILMENS